MKDTTILYLLRHIGKLTLLEDGMKNFDVDFTHLNNLLNPDNSRLPFKENEHNFVRVAFDLFRMKGNGNPEHLWKVQADDDGNEYLIRTYEDPNEEGNLEVKANWNGMLDKKAENLTVAYQSVPIHKFAMADYNVSGEKEGLLFRDMIVEKLNKDDDFLQSFINHIPNEKIAVLRELGIIKR